MVQRLSRKAAATSARLQGVEGGAMDMLPLRVFGLPNDNRQDELIFIHDDLSFAR